jgi:hypothetical protein
VTGSQGWHRMRVVEGHERWHGVYEVDTERRGIGVAHSLVERSALRGGLPTERRVATHAFLVKRQRCQQRFHARWCGRGLGALRIDHHWGGWGSVAHPARKRLRAVPLAFKRAPVSTPQRLA